MTLSLQMPILPNKAKETEYIPLLKEVPVRIKAGIDFLEKKGIKPVVLIGHSLGATMAADFLATNNDQRVKAFTGIGMRASLPEKERLLDTVVSLKQIQQPVLDIYGSNSIDRIVNSARQRAASMVKAGNAHSSQVKIEGANHFYNSHEPQLLKTIITWLEKLQAIDRDGKVSLKSGPH